ncbi:hypothetical protein Tco_0110612 [Tanacetum coccineum]
MSGCRGRAVEAVSRCHHVWFKYINEVIKGVTFRHERHATDVATTSSSMSKKRNNMDHRIGVNGLQLCMFLVVAYLYPPQTSSACYISIEKFHME